MALICLVWGVSSTAQGFSNPITIEVDQNVRRNGITIGVRFPAEFWFPFLEPWNGIVTANNGLRIHNASVLADWPRHGFDREDAETYFSWKWSHYDPNSYYTADESKRATPKYNCWSYCFDRTQNWVTFPIALVQDDYEIPGLAKFATASEGVATNFGHGVKIFFADAPLSDLPNTVKISKVVMKDGGSQLFTYEYDNPRTKGESAEVEGWSYVFQGVYQSPHIPYVRTGASNAQNKPVLRIVPKGGRH